MTAQDLKLWLREQPWMQPLRLANLKRRHRGGVFPDWKRILGADWDRWVGLRDHAQSARQAPRVLLATGIGIHATASSFDSYLGVALTARGARCDILLCDAALPACLAADYTWYPDAEQFARRGSLDDLCTSCLTPAQCLFGEGGLGLPVIRYSSLLTDADRARAHELAAETPPEAIGALELDGMTVGEAARAGVLRFFARGEIDLGNDVQVSIMRRYLEAACLALFAMRNLLAREKYDVVVGHHGIYVPQALVAAAARQMGVRFVTWNPAYRSGCFIFSHGETYHHAMLHEPVSAWEALILSEAQTAKLMRYLEDRSTGAQDWITFHPADADASGSVITKLGLDPAKPTVTMLTSVIWDAQLHYRQRAFKNQIEWALQTIRHFAQRSDVQLAIRIHPAEERGALPSRQPIAYEIEAAFPQLPGNVVLIRPGDRVSTYALAETSDAVVIYATKTGIELAARGVPVIVAGESWLKGKGIGFDCDDAESYERTLGKLPFRRRLDAERTARAQAYAYHFFFRRMIEMPALRVASTPGVAFGIRPSGLAPFMAGGSAPLDYVCKAILEAKDFVFDSA